MLSVHLHFHESNATIRSKWNGHRSVNKNRPIAGSYQRTPTFYNPPVCASFR